MLRSTDVEVQAPTPTRVDKYKHHTSDTVLTLSRQPQSQPSALFATKPLDPQPSPVATRSGIAALSPPPRIATSPPPKAPVSPPKPSLVYEDKDAIIRQLRYELERQQAQHETSLASIEKLIADQILEQVRMLLCRCVG